MSPVHSPATLYRKSLTYCTSSSPASRGKLTVPRKKCFQCPTLFTFVTVSYANVVAGKHYCGDIAVLYSTSVLLRDVYITGLLLKKSNINICVNSGCLVEALFVELTENIGYVSFWDRNNVLGGLHRYVVIKQPANDSLSVSAIKALVQSRRSSRNYTHIAKSKTTTIQSTATHIDPALKRLIDEIHASDDTRGQEVVFEKTPKYTCPEKLRKVNGVEDLLCMNPPRFDAVVKNPCWHDARGRWRCLPYFQLIGMDKSGSTDLFDKVAGHPEVIKNKGALNKETMWWSWKRYGLWLDAKKGKLENFKTYTDYFSVAAERIKKNLSLITGDGTPMDLWDERGWVNLPQNAGRKTPLFLTPHLVNHVNPHVKLIVIFREPVNRLLSDYCFLKIGRQTAKSFHEEVVRGIRSLHACTRTRTLRTCLYHAKLIQSFKARLHLGFYSIFLRDWLRVFPRKQFLIMRTEDYSSDIARHIQYAFDFLDLGKISQQTIRKLSTSSRKHVTKKRKAVSMLEKTRALVHELYKPFMKDLAFILHDDKYLWHNV
ncbi:carbohydrate sulfotransferase 15-like [Mya arenaria]|uniref:carbohydrate sulfotransferase 15-like n=1 Tax=Mya arenaria TaxID=6604 RepID=UPI0022DF78AF|nr:carbohydrate sulfotransferase 15-like [Mya arenaria]